MILEPNKQVSALSPAFHEERLVTVIQFAIKLRTHTHFNGDAFSDPPSTDDPVWGVRGKVHRGSLVPDPEANKRERVHHLRQYIEQIDT